MSKYSERILSSMWIMVVFVFTSLSISIASQNFDDEFNKANTSAQLEVLLKKYYDENERIIPKLESVIINEIKNNGVGNRLLVKDIMTRSNSSGSLTIEGTDSDFVGLLMEFPSDGIPISISMGSGGPSIPFGDSSIHRFKGKVSFGGKNCSYTFIGEGEKTNRLTFCLLNGIGYVYLRGKGKVIFDNGKEVKLGY